MARQTHLRREAVAGLSATLLEEKFNRLVDVGLSLAGRVRMRELIAEGRWREAISILQNVPRDLPYIDRLFITDPAGVLRADVPEIPSVHGRSFAHRDWYRGVSAGWRPYVSDIYERSAEPVIPVVAVAIPLRRLESGEVLGVLVLQVATDTVLSWTETLDAAPGAAVCFVDRSGMAIQYPRDPAGRPVMDFRALARTPEGVRRVRHPVTGGELLAGFAGVSQGWTAVAVRSADLAFAGRRSTLALQGSFYLLMLGLAAGLALAVGRALERRRAAELLTREVNQRLQSSNQELDAFTYSVSHDLRAPLRAIAGYCRILQEDCAPRLDDEGRRCLGVVIANANRMGRLIDDLLAFSRLGRLPMLASTVAMKAMAKGVFEELRAADGTEPVDFRLGDLPEARGDASMLRQVWQNLISNALKYSRGRNPRVVEVGASDSNGATVYFVKDNGAGFDMKYVDKLFGVFQRLHSMEEFEGTGVGLALVHRIVTKHGGRVWAEGQVGEGATFRFTLPNGKV